MGKKERFIRQMEVENLRPVIDESLFDPAAALEKYRIDLQEEIIENPILLTINDVIIATLGNYSLWIGKPKGRKTFLATALAAAAVCGYCKIEILSGIVRTNNKILYFDTEQSLFHAQRTAKRICKQTGLDHPANFEAFGLRPQSPAERLVTIDYAIKNTPGLALVVIDGIADLLSCGINDEEEAIELVSHLLRWTLEYNIHIITILHQNKNDSNARGHIGTYLQNKAETVISINKNPKDRNISIVHAEYCRDKDFEDFAFMINDEGLPILTESPKPESSALIKRKNAFEAILSPTRTMTRTQLVKEYMEQTGVKERTAHNHITTGVAEKLLQYDEKTKGYKLFQSADDEVDLFQILQG